MGILGSAGSFLGSKAEGKGQRKARKEYEALREEGRDMRKQLDSWSTVAREDGKTGVGKAGDELYSLLFGGGDYELSAAGKFASEQGQKAIRRQASSTGMRASGNVLYELSNFTTGVASQDYWANINNLMNLSGASNMVAIGQMQLQNSQVATQGIAAGHIGEAKAKAAGIGAIASGLETAVTGAMTGGAGGGGFAGALGGIFGA